MNINNITLNILTNYDENVERYISKLNEIDCKLVYRGKGLKDAILTRQVYACSILYTMKKNKYLNNTLPIMIGSKLDICIRKFNRRTIHSLADVPNLLDHWEVHSKFEPPDIAITCFIINGILKQIPFFITNDTSNVHIVNKSIVRLYRYDFEERGRQLSMYFDNNDTFARSNLVIKLNNGESIKLDDERDVFTEVNEFFECPYDIKTKVYFKKVFSQGFMIDNIENKIIISPAHLFYKLFTRTLFIPLKNRDLVTIKKKHTVVVKSIENGDLLHIISKKTIFHKENNMKNKMVTNKVRVEVKREIGQNDEVFMEKQTTCYRDVNCQYYPYIPYLSHFAQIQISNKVKSPKAISFNNSFIGFLCIFGTSETNVGRSMMLARDTFVSTQNDLKPVYEALRLEQGGDECYVVVNSACIEVTRSCFDTVDPDEIKRRFKYIECYRTDDNFLHVTYKVGLLFKRLEDHVWVTARDLAFWSHRLYGFTDVAQLIEHKGHNFVTSHSLDIIKYYKHNAFPKNILTLNTLKNAVLSTTPDYSLYFCETMSAYTPLTTKHTPILKAENELSRYYLMYLPRIMLMYASFKGSTQEDAIVMRNNLNLFDIHRLYTVKIKFKNNATKYFHATEGPPNPAEARSFLGTVVCSTRKIEIVTQTMHLIIENINDNVTRVYFSKPNFKVLNYHVSETFLFVSIGTFQKLSQGDKLCSLNGQKGVVTLFDTLPRARYASPPDLIINPYCLINRQTMGQLIESLELGGRDYDSLLNSDGRSVSGSAFLGPVHYFPTNFKSCEHIYYVTQSNKDKITGQPNRGRSRAGGMKCGAMETLNCFLGNGIASCYEEKCNEHSDRIVHDDIPIQKSTLLCIDDASFYKCDIKYNRELVVKELS